MVANIGLTLAPPPPLRGAGGEPYLRHDALMAAFGTSRGLGLAQLGLLELFPKRGGKRLFRSSLANGIVSNRYYRLFLTIAKERDDVKNKNRT